MKLRKSIVYPLTITILIASILLILNYDYFNYLSNLNAKFEYHFDIISGFVGGDSRFYYNMDSSIIETIYAGVISGGVKFGSIMSLIGIYLYVSLSELLFGNKIIGVFILNTMIATLILKNIKVRDPKSNITVLFISVIAQLYTSSKQRIIRFTSSSIADN